MESPPGKGLSQIRSLPSSNPDGFTVRQTPDGLLATILHFAGSNLFRHLVGGVTALLRPKLLTPELFGLWSLFRLVPTYGTHLHLGARAAMRFQLPRLLARGETEEAQRVQGTVYWGTLWLHLPVALGLGVAALHPQWRPEVRWGLLLVGMLLLANWHYEFFISWLKGRERFRVVSASNYVIALTGLLATAALIPWLGLEGALLGLLAATAAGSLYLARRGNLVSPRGFDRELFVSLAKMGFPILVFDLAMILLRTVDRLVIGATLGAEQVGFYGLGAMLMGFVLNIPGSSREVLEPRIMAALATPRDHPGAEEHYVVRPIAFMALVMALLVGPGWVLLPPVIDLLLPAYREAVPATRILLLGSYFLALFYPLRGLLVARGWMVQAAGVLGGALLLDLALALGAIRAGWGIVGVAWAGLLSALAMTLAMLLLVHLKHRPTPLGFRRHLPHLLLPFPLVCGSIWLVERLPGSGWGHPLLVAAVQGVVITLPLLGLWWWLWGREWFGHRRGGA